MTETTIELIVDLNIAGVPVVARGSLENGQLGKLSGLVTIPKSLKEFLAALGVNFGGAGEILKQLTGDSDIKLDSLALGYRNREPKFAQVAVTLTADGNRCRFVCLKRVGKDGFVAGLELRLEQTLFKNNPLSGLVGEISLGDLGLYYSSDAFQNVEYEPGQDFQPADQLTLRADLPAIKGRDFTKGINWSGGISVRGINLLDWSAIKSQRKLGPPGGQAQPGGDPAKKEAPGLTGSTTWIDLNKSLGPLSVRRIGFSYEAPRVGIKFDAGLQLSVLTFSLEGLGLSYPVDKFSDSYNLIDSFALLSVSFGTRFEVALLGLSRIQLPKPPAPVLGSAELAIRAVISPDSGLLSMEARLTDNSYLLRKDFKLRGGFAFYTWFAGEHEGDFVVTIGGYHPKFKPPAHYPKPDLVEFACKISDAVAIRGYCYFALCPSAIMAGGGLSIVYQLGDLRAWFIAQADFLIQWKPLYYDILIAVSIGVALRLDTGAIRVWMALELSAMVALYGPPLGGIARISVLFFTIEVQFGEDKLIPPPLLWESNVPEKSFAKAFLPNPTVTTIAITDGLLKETRIKNEKKGEMGNYYVSPQKLVLSVRTQVPATDVQFNEKPLKDRNGGLLPLPKPKVNKKDATLGVRATGKSTMYSLVNIALKPGSGSSAEAEEYLQQYLEFSLTAKSVPSALWGQPIGEQEKNKLPAANEQMIDDALVGIEIKTRAGPRPWQTPVLDLDVLAYDRFPKPFDWRTPKPSDSLGGFKPKTISNTIATPSVVALRNGILAELARTDRKIMKPEEIHFDELSKNAEYIFQDMPEMARVGQYPPRGYLEAVLG